MSYITKEKEARKSFIPASKFLSTSGMPECDRAFLNLAIYLFMVEGAYASYMNFLCFLLILEGHDLYDIFNRKFVSSFKEIEIVNFETKEQFLKEHHLGLFNKGLKRKLRNAIAHYDFKIEKDGTVRVKGQMIDIGTEIFQLADFMGVCSFCNEKNI